MLWCKQRAAEDAAAAVGMTYSTRDADGLDELTPPVLTLEDAVAMNSFHDCAGGPFPLDTDVPFLGGARKPGCTR